MRLAHALSVRSDFSVGKSTLQVQAIINKAKELGYESVGLVDSNLSAMVEFSNKCKKEGIKPLIGFTIQVCDDPTYKKPSKASGEKEKPNNFFIAKVFLKSKEAVQSALALLTKANDAEHFYYVPRVSLLEFLQLEDVVVLSGDFYGLFSHPEYQAIADRLYSQFGDDFYAEVVPADTPLWDLMNLRALKSGIQCVATYPALYADPSQADSADVMLAIANGMKMDERRRPVQHVRDFCFHEPSHISKRIAQAARRLAKHDGFTSALQWAMALANIDVVAAKCNYAFERQPVSLPKLAEDEFRAVVDACQKGFHARLRKLTLGYRPDDADLPEYVARLKYELGVLNKMNFSGYFLLVADLVSWAKTNGIIVGPGRGSVGGSLVAYLMGITDVDPIRFNLFFERFINPSRQDLPDADLDFMSSKRHLVQEYLVGKYGADRVAGISNYSTLASASALRDTGRVFGLSALELTPTKLVPKEHGQSYTLTDAAKAVPELEKFRDDHPTIWRHALSLEGAMRSFGQHAAGIVVAGEPVSRRAVLETRATELPVVNWDKRVVEDWGLVKMDLLGLSTLDVMEIARRYILERHGVTVDYLSIPLDDARVMQAFGRGETTGVFQFESGGMKNLLKELAKGGELTFDDITAATALYRPGPMDSGLMADFVQIKQGIKEPYYEHPNMEPALRDTYGVIVYQEQVMQVARDVAGYSMVDADKLRKIMGKKQKEEMEAEREKWVNGCVTASGMDSHVAGALFDKIEAFAGYGFNKSHAVEYSIISFWTMWLRVNYPAEYFAACMSIVKEDKLPGLVRDAREIGIEVLPPNINLSSDRYVIPDDKHILAPFNAVLGVSDTTARRIMELRSAVTPIIGMEPGKTKRSKPVPVYGPPKVGFASVAEVKDMAGRPGSKVNARVVENLDAVGAFAELEPEEGTRQLPALHPDRRKSQMELMPGLIIDHIKADRTTDVSDRFVRLQVFDVVKQYRECEGCDLAGQPHPAVRMKTNVKFMVISDCPSWEEEKKGKLMDGDGSLVVRSAITSAGLAVGDGYYTALVKARKSGKFLSNAQINGCKRFIERELELIKPAVIVALGSATIKWLLPELKGGTEELAGKAVYVPSLDATVVCGINPAQVHFKPEKMAVVEAVFEKVAEIVG